MDFYETSKAQSCLWGGKNLKLDQDKTCGWVFRFPSKEEEKKIRNLSRFCCFSLEPPENHVYNLFSVTVISALKNGVRFTHDKLETLAERYTDLEADYNEKQQELVAQAMEVASSYVPVFESTSALLGEIDVFAG